MSNPLALLPLAAAAGGGHMDGFEAQQLVAAGLTLLQRCAPLVRALDGHRSAILLPTCPAVLAALAASDGRGAVLLDPQAAPPEIAAQVQDAGVGAAFTIESLASRLPDHLPRVLLDHAPRTARFLAQGMSRDVDLGSHHGLALEGTPDPDGRDEEAVVVYTSTVAGRPLGARLSHRSLLANARGAMHAVGNSADDHVLALLPFSHRFGLTVTGVAPLLAGARVTTMASFTSARALALIAEQGVTELVGVPEVFRALLASIGNRRAAPGDLRVCICAGAPLEPELQDRWFDTMGVELRQGYGLAEAGAMCLFNRVDHPNARGTLGVPLPGVQVSIREPISATGDPGAELPPDAVGEMCVRGESVFDGYVSGGTDGLRVAGGWLYTGDAGVARPDGTIVFRGAITSSGQRAAGAPPA